MRAVHGKQILVLLIFSFIFVSATIVIPDKVNTDQELERVQFGYPLSYLAQNQTALSPPSFPIVTTILSPWEHPVTLSIWKFIFSVSLVMVFLLIMLLTMSKLLPYSNLSKNGRKNE